MSNVLKTESSDSPILEDATLAVAKVVDILNAKHEFVYIKDETFKIGSGVDCDLRLNSQAVPTLIGEFRQIDGSQWNFIPARTNVEATLNGEQIKPGGVYVLKDKASLEVSVLFEIVVTFVKSCERTVMERVSICQKKLNKFAGAVHKRVLEIFDANTELARIDGKDVDDERLSAVERHIDASAENEGLFDPKNEDFFLYLAGVCVHEGLMSRFVERRASVDDQTIDERSYVRMATVSPRLERDLRVCADKIGARFNLNEMNASLDDLTEINDRFWSFWFSIAPKLSDEFCRYLALKQLKKTLKDLLFGYGPLEDLLRTSTVSEIMVVDSQTIFIEKNGRLENSGRRFFSNKTTTDVIRRIVARVHRSINASQPLVDARLNDGSRVNAIIEPIAVSGPCLTIRRFPEKRLTIDELVENPRIRSLTVAAAEFLKASILARKNILVSGGTGTGKTTLLNCLCDYIPDDERIVTIEDVAELQIKKRHVVRLESKPKNNEGVGEYTIRDLVKNALRMRPDRIVVGECRGGEALDMLQAMNTGHDGSLTTIHANSPKDAVLRLETLAQMTPDVKLPVDALDRQIVAAVDLIVQLKRLRGGRRCVTEITEVSEIDKDTGEVVLRPIFAGDGGKDSVLTPTGSLPTYIQELLEAGHIDAERFYVI